MIKKLLLAIALFCVLAVQALAVAPYESVCKIDMGKWTGSGTVIAVGEDCCLILTCRHVAERVNSHARLLWPAAGGQMTPAVTYYVAPGKGFDTDVALMVSDLPKGVKPLKVVPFKESDGPFTGIGYRGEHMRILGSGSAREVDGVIVLPTPAVGGMSGGPLLNRRAEIVGIVVGSTDQWMVASTGAPMHQAIERFKRDGKPTPQLRAARAQWAAGNWDGSALPNIRERGIYEQSVR